MAASLKTILKSYIKKAFYHLPIQKNKIVFVNYDFKGYGDNLKYIAEEIKRQGLPCKLIWLVRDDYDIPCYIKKVYYLRGVAWFYELSTAGIIISNIKNQVYCNYKKRENQYYLQTWHGGFPLKFIEKEVEDTLSPSYVAASKADSAVTNAIVSGNELFSKILKESFWLPEHCVILEYGSPRNDFYFKGDDYRSKLKLQYGFSMEDIVILYAPTFRDNHDFSCYNLDFERLRQFLCNTYGKRVRIIVRLHPNVYDLADNISYNDGIINGTVCADQQELCMISDCMITDYSGMMADFMLMKKPVFLYVPDLDNYSDRTTGRGLRDMYYKLPSSLNKTQEELESCMSAFDKVKFGKELNRFVQEYYRFFDDGHASEKVVNHLRKVMKM